MAEHVSEQSRTSFSWSQTSLREQAPSSLSRAGPLRDEFIAANDQQPQMHGRGSKMIEREKPFPELKPRYANQVKKNSFDQAWLKEYRDVKLREFKAARNNTEPQKTRSEPLLAR